MSEDFRSTLADHSLCPTCGGDLAGAGLAGCCGVLAVPLAKRGGGEAGYAFVDLADAERVVWRRWLLNDNGYATTGGPGAITLHRLLLGLARGDKREGDHINWDTLDNRRSNLRAVTHTQNQQNRAANGRYRGVSRHSSGRYVARVHLNGVCHYLGLYPTAEDADRVASAFRRKHMPFSEADRLAA